MLQYNQKDVGKGMFEGGNGSLSLERARREGLSKLIWFIHQYDTALEKLAREGGGVGEMLQLTRLLQKGLVIAGPWGAQEVKLSEPAGVAAALGKTGLHDVHFDVHRTELGLPAYYICRVEQDYWGTYGLVVEDLYRSKRYTLDEPRFVALYKHGRNTQYLRLSGFRPDTARLFGEEAYLDQPRTDHLLYLLGRYVLQGTWHVDQRFSFQVADAFDLPHLKQVIELIYMCLSCDLSALRRFLNPDLHRFFKEVYPNRGLAALMRRLPGMTGVQLNALSEKALACYLEVNGLFNEFLKTETAWQSMQTGKVPLWKLVLGNTARLPLVANQVMGQEAIAEARTLLENEAALRMRRLVETTKKKGGLYANTTN